MRRFLPISLCLALSACASSNSSIPDTFTLSEPELVVDQNVGYLKQRQILITEPSALKMLDSEQILVRTSPSAIQYLASSQWSDRLPRVYQSKLARAFENTEHLGGVGLPGQGLAIDYQILTSIRAFDVDVSSTPTARVDISVKVLNDRTGVVKAQKVFRSDVVVAGRGNDQYIAALDTASDRVTEDIISWSLTKLR